MKPMDSAVSFKGVVVAVAALVVLGVAFLIYSGAVTFSNWPWTRTEAHASGAVMGFEIGASKRYCFQRAMELEDEGEIRALNLVDAEPGTYDERFKGTNLTEADFERVKASNIWRLGLTGVNAWLLLTFEDDALVRVERKDYRGPTE
jgi:hypothetical protein